MNTKRVSLALSLILILATFLSACGPTTAPPAPTQAAAPPTQAPQPTQVIPPTQAPQPTPEPAKENVCTFAYPRTVNQLDPSLVLAMENNIMFNVYGTLTIWDEDKGVVPMLATSWESNTEATEWTFHIRDGVKCHDGTAFTADAVKFSIERTVAKGSLAYVWPSLDKVEVVDPATVKFTLKWAMPLPTLLANGWGAFMMCPTIADQPDDWFASGHGIGAGPYMFESYEPGVRLVLTRFPDYWGGWKPGQCDKVVYVVAEDPAVREQMLRSGEADLTLYVPFDDFEALNATGDIKAVAIPAFQNLIYHLRTTRPPLNDVRIRQALAYAFPYEQAAQGTYGGYATVAQGPVPQIMWKPPTPLNGYNYDLEKAQALLQEAGVAPGLELRVGVETGDRDALQATQLWQAELAKIGINLNIEQISSAVRWDEVYNPDTKFDIMYQHMVIGFNSPSDFLGALFNSKLTFYPFSGWDNAQFNSLEDEALTKEATDKAQADALYQQAIQLFLDECPAITVLDLPQDWEYRTNIEQFKPSPLYGYAFSWYDVIRK